MKNRISVLAVSSALLAGAASAADLPSRKEAPVFVPPPAFSWTGPYVGLNIGGGWLDRHHDNNWGWGWGWNNNNNSDGGVVGGVTLGWNYQLSPLFVVGLETDFQGTSIGSSNDNNWWGLGWNDFNRVRVPWFGTVRGRVGIALLDSRLLIYGTGGFAYGEVDPRFNWWWGNNNNDVRGGWTAGGGVEWAFLPNWSAKVEYLYTELNNNNNNNNWGLFTPIFFPNTFPFPGFGAWNWNWNRHTRINTVRAGINYHFNLFTPAPVVARY